MQHWPRIRYDFVQRKPISKSLYDNNSWYCKSWLGFCNFYLKYSIYWVLKCFKSMSNYFGLAYATDGISFCVCEWKCVKRRGGSVSSPFSVQLSSSSARTFPARTIPPATQANFGLVLLLVKPTFVSTKSWIDFIFPRSHTFSHFIQLFWFLIFWLGCGWAGHGDYWANLRLFQSTIPLRATVLHGLGQRPCFLSETIKHRVLLPIKVLSYHLHSEDIS